MAPATPTCGGLIRSPTSRRQFRAIGCRRQLNEHVVGDAWPNITARQARLREALEIIRLLWRGGYQSYDGRYFQLDDACVFDLPATPPVIAVAAGGVEAATLAAELGDGLFTTDPDAELVTTYHEAGGDGPRYAEVPLAFGADVDAGFDHLVLINAGPDVDGFFEHVADHLGSRLREVASDVTATPAPPVG